MNNLNQPVRIKKPDNPFKFVLAIILVALAIFVIVFTVNVFKMSKKINDLQTEINIEATELKQFLKETYTDDIRGVIEGKDNYWIGAEQPLITIVGFSDFACSHCKESYTIMRELSIEYGNDVKIIFRDRPAYEHSLTLSLAAYCAGEQGKFWAMHDKLFQYQSTDLGSDLNDLTAIAKQTGVETEQFSNCIVEEKYIDKIKQNFIAAQTLDVNGTPTWFINGQKVEGSIPKSEWQALINRLIN
ncbi:MAG: thioredoxin domain-containing protein [bacterium]